MKTKVTPAHTAHAQLVGQALLTALQSLGALKSGGKYNITISIHQPETVTDLTGDDLLICPLNSLSIFSRRARFGLWQMGISRIYQLITRQEQEITREIYGRNHHANIRLGLEALGLGYNTPLSPKEIARLQKLHQPDPVYVKKEKGYDEFE